MRLTASFLVAIALPELAFGQRVVDANAPWKREALRMSETERGGVPDLAPAIRDGEFVSRIGSVLMLAGKPFRFHGNNIYFNQADIVYGRISAVEETLDKMTVLGLTVARFNGHNDNPLTADPAAIQLSPGVYSEPSLVALDRSVALAKSRNIRLILRLTNNWEPYGGIRRYVGWHLGRVPSQNESSLFYTEPAIRTWFQSYARMLVDRRNTVTGITYRNEPTILAWELGNELRNPTGGRADALVAWTAEMAAFLKLLDANHLVADGGEGFDDAPELYSGLKNRYVVSGSDGCSYHRLARIPDLDLLSYHLYPAGWNLNDDADAALYIRRHEEIARENGKVAYMGEFGKRADDKPPFGCSRAPGRAFDPQRARVYQAWLQMSALEQASAGVMVWQLINDGKDDCEGFQVYCPGDAQSCGVLRQTSERLAAAPVVVSAASFKPLRVAPSSLASLFGVGLDGTQVAMMDVAGGLHEAPILFSSPGQINFQVPDALAAGPAIVRVVRNRAIENSTAVIVSAVAPGLFTANADGKGFAAGTTTLIQKDGSRTTQLLTEPISIPEGGAAVLSLFGTGIRGGAVTAEIRGLTAPVLYAGAQGEFAGLDQVNVQIPAEAAGAGEVEVRLTVAGQAANVVRIALR